MFIVYVSPEIISPSHTLLHLLVFFCIQKYYRGLNSLPVRMSSTDVQSQWSLAFPECVDVTNLDSPFLQPGNVDAAFSTFGKYENGDIFLPAAILLKYVTKNQ